MDHSRLLRTQLAFKLPAIAWLAGCVLATSCRSAPPSPPPPPPSPAPAAMPAGSILLDANPDHLRLAGVAAKQADAQIIPLAGAGFDRGWRVQINQQPLENYQVQLVSRLPAPLKRGDTVLLTVWARAIASSRPDHRGCIELVLEQSAAPYDKAIARRFDLGPDWQRLDVPATVGKSLGNAGAQVALQLGYFPQTVEIAGVELRRFAPAVPTASLPQTPMTYAGREPTAAWRQQALARIDAIRKANLTIRVTDSAGHPVAGAKVEIRMRRQAFAFGCAYADSLIAGADSQTPAGRAYQQHFLELFNTAVDENGLKWPNWDNISSRRTALAALQWMADHHIPVRGHNLVWPAWPHLPPDLKALANNPTALAKRIDNHIRDITTALAGRVIEWDVVNEPYENHDLQTLLGPTAMAHWFQLAHTCDPAARLYLNEDAVPTLPPSDPHYTVLFNTVRTLQRDGAPIGGIGMESHFSDGLTSPADLLTIYDRFAALNLPIRITELDIDTPDEQLQADYLRDFLIASYSDQEINGILLWSFWQSHDWRPNAALFRKDWSPKPAAQVWQDLVLRQWRTNAAGITTADGTYSTRAFLGDYEVKVTAGSRTQSTVSSLPRTGSVSTVTLR